MNIFMQRGVQGITIFATREKGIGAQQRRDGPENGQFFMDQTRSFIIIIISFIDLIQYCFFEKMLSPLRGGSFLSFKALYFTLQ
jgi:hypothetical protein